MENLSKQVKRNIQIYYISEICRAALLFQTAIWFGYESQFLSGDKIAFYGALILIFDVLFQVPTGAFADIFGKKLAIIIGNVFTFIAAIILGVFPSELAMILFCMFYGIGNAFVGGTYSAFLYNMLKDENRVDLYPAVKANGSLRFQWVGSIFLVLGGYAYEIYKPLPYILMGAGVLTAAISAFFFTGYDGKITSKFNFRSFIKQNILGFKEIFKNSETAKLSIAFISMGAIAFASQRFLSQPFMSEIGLDEVTKGWVGMILKVIAGIVGFLIIKRKGLVNNKFFVLIIPVGMVLSMIPIKYFSMPLALIFLWGIAFASANADLFMSPIINAKLDSNIRTAGLSAINMLTSTTVSIIQLFAAPYMANLQMGNYYQLLGILTAVIIIPMMLSLIKLRKSAEIDISLVGD
jgi:MFS family permease